MWRALAFIVLYQVVKGDYPMFDFRTRMRVLLLPFDLRPGSVIYRLRGTDAEFEYPLRFSVVDDVGKSIVRIENMPCNPTHTYCQANVYLTKRLEPDRVYDLILSLKDAIGRETKVDATIKATRGNSHFEDIFPYVPNVIMVPESTKVGTVLDFVLARKSPSSSHHSYLELWGSEKFRIVQNTFTKEITNGSIILTGELDFEEKTMYTLHVFCLDPYTVASEDTRNIAGFQIPVVVEDDQDMPPEFSSIPPVTKISKKLSIGDKILKVEAHDGDRGNPRTVRYSLANDGSSIYSYFNISEKTGEIYLAKPLDRLMAMTFSNQPLILTVSAEEVKKNLWEPPAMITTAQVALLLENEDLNTPPYFENNEYSARIAENSLQGTPIIFGEPYSTMVKDDDPGRNGVFSLSLENNNGTFEIYPTVGEQKANFVIRVRNNELLDYEERTYVVFTIVAKEVTPAKETSDPLQSTANVTVYLDDQNDNPPVFFQKKYEAEIPENVTVGTTITQVQATDVDTGIFGKVFYTNILGNFNHSLAIDSFSGVITVATNNHGFDRESAKEYQFMVEARDMEGVGNRAMVPLVVKLLDVNDETPEFERQTFEFILQPNLKSFTSRAFIKAIDKDAEEPNNIVRYEIISGNYENKFVLDEMTGELTLRGKLSDTNIRRQISRGGELYNEEFERKDFNFNDEMISVIILTVRAYDLGVPHRFAYTYVRIYPPESRARTMNFIVPGANLDKKKIEELLRQLTGGRVSVQDIKPFTGSESGTDLSWRDGSHDEKSVVSATVFYDGNSYVDLNQVEKKLTKNKTQAIVEASVTEYKNENRVLFWLLIFFLLLFLVILLTLILCCIWQGFCICPWFEFNRKGITSPTENIKFIAHEGNNKHNANEVKAVTYFGKKEAWSGRNGERTYHFETKPKGEKLIRQMKIENSDDFGATGATFRSHVNEDPGVNIIYSREFIEKERNPTMVVEDVEVNSYPIKTTVVKAKSEDVTLKVNSDRDPDSDSIRRHEIERGSDLDKSFRKSESSPEKLKNSNYQKDGQKVIKEYRLVLERPENNSDDEMMDVDQEESTRDQYFIREGNTEILRLVTRGNQEDKLEKKIQEPDPAFIKLDRGKDLIMKKFMEDQKQTASNALSKEFQKELIRRLQKEFDERQSETSFQNKSMVMSENICLLRPSNIIESSSNYEMEPRFLGYTFHNQDTQSLPGHIEISTQTEREFGTQTEELSNLRPPRRKVRSDNELSDDDDDDDESENKAVYDKAVEALDLGKGWIHRNSGLLRGKKIKRYKMKTPILEESEIDPSVKLDNRPAMFKMPEYELIINGTGPGAYTENKSSILRRRKMKEKILEDEKLGNDDYSSGEESNKPKKITKPRRSRRDVTDDTKEAPIANRRTESLNKLYEAVQELGESELRKIKMETKQRAASLNRFYNTLAVFELETEKNLDRYTSQNSLKSDKEKEKRESEVGQIPLPESQNKEKEKKQSSDDEKENNNTQEIASERNQVAKQELNKARLWNEEELEKSGRPKKSKYMDWYDDLNKKPKKGKTKKKKKKEDDLDSGIAMSSLFGSKPAESNNLKAKTKSEKLLEKKSVFTIAYDGVRTKSIRPDTNSSEKY